MSRYPGQCRLAQSESLGQSLAERLVQPLAERLAQPLAERLAQSLAERLARSERSDTVTTDGSPATPSSTNTSRAALSRIFLRKK